MISLSRAPLLHGLALNPAWISNLMPSKVWHEITYPFPTPIFDNHTSNMVTSSGTIRHGQKKFLSCQSDQYLVIMVIYGSPDRFIGRINLATAQLRRQVHVNWSGTVSISAEIYHLKKYRNGEIIVLKIDRSLRNVHLDSTAGEVPIRFLKSDG